MPRVSDEIIVLKKTKLAEMDLIITGFSTSGQQVRVVVKGGRKPGSRRGAHLELFSHTRVLLHQGNSSLLTCTEAELVQPFSGCRSDIEHSAAAA
ncbi:MAG: DNA repair protein RecO, partial [Coriobacteriales bacterium]|nr:DNA repair protein RecO [Coriobacteriales bacterium]